MARFSATAAPARADDASLYRGAAPRPGPDILYRLGSARTARVTVLRGKRVVRRGKARSRRPGRTYRLRIAPSGMRPGSYRIRLTLSRRGTKTRRFTLAAQRL